MAAKFDPKAKAKRQKIIAAVLGLVLVGVLAWQIPGVLKMMNKKPPAAATATTPPPAAPAVPGAAPATPVAAPAASGTLVDSDPAPQAATGQLVSFDRFASKDPFAQQLSAPAPPPPAPVNPKPAHAPTATSTSPPPPASRTLQSAPSSATISVNGVTEQVLVGGHFPQDDPIFVLVSLTKTKAKVSISGGSLDTGASAVTLTRGKTLTLQNTVDGARYELVFRSVT